MSPTVVNSGVKQAQCQRGYALVREGDRLVGSCEGRF